MKRKQYVMGDPELDRIFGETYRETMTRAEVLERDRHLTDHIDAYVELFQRELSGRDLTEAEKTALTVAFKGRLAEAEKIRESRVSRRKRNRQRIGALAGTVGVIVVFILFVTYRPLKPIDDVTANLDSYIERVEAGSGGYADDFYKLLNRFDRRLGDSVEQSYREKIYEALDERFNELLGDLQSGDLTLIDDARKWAKLFPERADRNARKDMVENAGIKGFGGAAKRAFDKLKSWGEDAVEWVETQVLENKEPTDSPTSDSNDF